MDYEGTFKYRNHQVKYKIGYHKQDSWRIPFYIQIDNDKSQGCLGTIPVRLPDIKRFVRKCLYNK